MRTSAEVSDFVTTSILRFYGDTAPNMLGGSPAGVHTRLRVLHEVWAFIQSCEDVFRRALRDAQEQERTHGVFCIEYKKQHPDATSHEIATYEVEVWKRISRAIGIL